MKLKQPTPMIPLGLLCLAFVAYLLPWTINPGVSLSLNGYDLAEWASLHPAVRASNPVFLLSFLLRLPPVCLTIAAVLLLRKSSANKLFVFIAIGLITVALLPPLEFFTVYRDDPNYQQQFMLAVLAFLGSMGALFLHLRDAWISGFIIALLLSAGISSGLGLVQAVTLMREFILPVQLGSGGLLLIASCLAGIVWQIAGITKYRGSSPKVELPLSAS